jgi:hypothetical protein
VPSIAVNLAQFETQLPAARADTGRRLLDDVRRELADLRALVQRQQERNAELERHRATAARAAPE